MLWPNWFFELEDSSIICFEGLIGTNFALGLPITMLLELNFDDYIGGSAACWRKLEHLLENLLCI